MAKPHPQTSLVLDAPLYTSTGGLPLPDDKSNPGLLQNAQQVHLGCTRSSSGQGVGGHNGCTSLHSTSPFCKEEDGVVRVWRVPPIPGLSRVTHNARAHQTTRTADTSSVGLGYVGRVPTGPIGHSGPFHITGHPITSAHYRWLWRTVTKGAITCGLVNNLCRTCAELLKT